MEEWVKYKSHYNIVFGGRHTHIYMLVENTFCTKKLFFFGALTLVNTPCEEDDVILCSGLKLKFFLNDGY